MVARTFRATRTQAAEERKGQERQRTSLEKRLAELRKAISRLVRVTDGRAERALSCELRALNDEYAGTENQLRELEAGLDRQEDLPCEQDVAEALRTIEPLWEELFPAEKERIVHLLVETVTVRPDGLTVRLRPTGLMALAAELQPDEGGTELLEATL
jgi:site-specific DNA recombinase